LDACPDVGRNAPVLGIGDLGSGVPVPRVRIGQSRLWASRPGADPEGTSGSGRNQHRGVAAPAGVDQVKDMKRQPLVLILAVIVGLATISTVAVAAVARGPGGRATLNTTSCTYLLAATS